MEKTDEQVHDLLWAIAYLSSVANNHRRNKDECLAISLVLKEISKEEDK